MLLTLLHISITCLPERKHGEIKGTVGKNKPDCGLVKKSSQSPLPSGSISQKGEVTSDYGGCHTGDTLRELWRWAEPPLSPASCWGPAKPAACSEASTWALKRGYQ